VVAPDAICQQFGAATARLFILFAGPPEQDTEWSDEGVAGCFRFLSRVWRLVSDNLENYRKDWEGLIAAASDQQSLALRRKLHQTIRKVTSDVEQRLHFNTAVSAMMELLNETVKRVESLRAGGEGKAAAWAVFSEVVDRLLLMLSPFCPHLADELWEMTGHVGTTYEQPWPRFDPELAKEEEVTLVVQVNGKVRDRIVVPAGASDEELKQAALASPRIHPYLGGNEPKRVIVVSGKLVNIVA